MKEFLERNIFWNVRIYKPNSIDISSRNYTKDFSKLFFSRLCDSCVIPEGVADNNDDRHHIKKYYSLVVILGVVSLIGNVVTFVHEIMILSKKNYAKERRLYNVLVLNLCFANLLMSVYLITSPIALRVFERINFRVCNAMGVISALSVQASASILMIITAYRLYGVLCPYKHVYSKLIFILLGIVWLTWLIVVTLPLTGESLFSHEFTREIEVELEDDVFHFSPRQIYRTVQTLSRAINVTDEPFSKVLHVLSDNKRNDVAVQLLKSFNLIDFERYEVNFVGPYLMRRWCSVEIFVDARNSTVTYFFLSLLIFNFVEFLFIFVAYLIMYLDLSRTRLNRFFWCFPLKPSVKNLESKTQERKTEDKKVYMRIFLVAVTDLVCGIAVCLIGLVHYFAGFVFDCSQNYFFAKSATPVVAVLITLNSIINPYIYSFHLWKNFLKRCCKQLKQLKKRIFNS